MNALSAPKIFALSLLLCSPVFLLGCDQDAQHQETQIKLMELQIQQLEKENEMLKLKVAEHEGEKKVPLIERLKTVVSKENLDKLASTDLGQSINVLMAEQNIDPQTTKVLMAQLQQKLKESGLDQDTIQTDMDSFKTDITTLQDVIKPGKELSAGERLRVIAALNNMLKNVDEIEKRFKTEETTPE